VDCLESSFGVGITRLAARVIFGINFLFALETTKTPVTVAPTIMADTSRVAVFRTSQTNFESTVCTGKTKVTVAFAKEALAVRVAIVGATLGNNTHLSSGAIVAAVTGFASTLIT
jgi:hypothetical protein